VVAAPAAVVAEPAELDELLSLPQAATTTAIAASETAKALLDRWTRMTQL
jgi:hypothetical protein